MESKMHLKSLLVLAALLPAATPLFAQAWDVRLDMPFPKGQSLPRTLLSGTGQAASGSLDTGRGYILGINRRIIRINPVLKLVWGAEVASWSADGRIQEGTGSRGSRLRQYGLGLQVSSQFWVPFTGVAAEAGLIQRFHEYKFQGAAASQSEHLARTWFRVGLRCRLPLPLLKPYVAAGYEQPLFLDRPREGQAVDLGSYLKAQGSGQEFQRMWTFGVGAEF